jgi:hypothetical protein
MFGKSSVRGAIAVVLVLATTCPNGAAEQTALSDRRQDTFRDGQLRCLDLQGN